MAQRGTQIFGANYGNQATVLKYLNCLFELHVTATAALLTADPVGKWAKSADQRRIPNLTV